MDSQHSWSSPAWLRYKEEPQFGGYSWYDALPKITDSEVLIDGTLFDERKSSQERPERIDLELTVEDPAGSSHEIRLPALIHVESSCDECKFVAVRQSPSDKR